MQLKLPIISDINPFPAELRGQKMPDFNVRTFKKS